MYISMYVSCDSIHVYFHFHTLQEEKFHCSLNFANDHFAKLKFGLSINFYTYQNSEIKNH